MQVSDVLRDLALGELRNLAMAQETVGQIRIADQNALINYMSDGLNMIYTRFNLRQKDVLIQQVGWVTNYHLMSKYAVNGNPDPVSPSLPRYILDLPQEIFVDDVVRILAVYDGRTREDLPLNDRGDIRSVFTPDPITLQVPHPRDGEPLGILYQALHIPLPLSVLSTHIHLPTLFYPALKSFVAHKCYMHMNTAETSAKAQEHYASFEAVCSQIEKSDSMSGAGDTDNKTRFEMNGWC